jgi:hypothetical protein
MRLALHKKYVHFIKELCYLSATLFVDVCFKRSVGTCIALHIALQQLQNHSNKLTNRGIPPTSSIVWNLAEEIKGAKVGKN